VDLEGVVFCAAAGNTARKGGATAAVLVWIRTGWFSVAPSNLDRGMKYAG